MNLGLLLRTKIGFSLCHFLCSLDKDFIKVKSFELIDSNSYQEKERYKLGNPKSLHYLNQSNCYELVGVSDAHDYLTTKRAMDIVGISQKEQVVLLLWI